MIWTLHNVDGSPNLSAAMAIGVCTAGLYKEDATPFHLLADVLGGTLAAFSANPITFTPDYGVITWQDNAVLVMAGTTNAAQWASHVASALFPIIDTHTNSFAVGSFVYGLAAVENAIYAAMRPAARGQVYLGGHSYGAAAANLFASHLKYLDQTPATVQMLTLGEPMSQSNESGVREADYHARLVAVRDDAFTHDLFTGVDPVTLSPPSFLQWVKFGLAVTIFAAAAGLRWRPRGKSWALKSTAIRPTNWETSYATILPLAADISFGLALIEAEIHDLFGTYLPRLLRQWQTASVDPQLQPLANLGYAYLGAPPVFPANLTPPIPSTTLNTAWQLPDGTVTDANRTDWATISASALVVYPTIRSSTVPVPALNTPTLKGTLFYDILAGGSSQSFYAVPGVSNVPTDFATMNARMTALAAGRSTLSQCADTPACVNPLLFRAIRIQDLTLKKKGYLSTGPGISLKSYAALVASQANRSAAANDEIEAAYKVIFTDNFGNNATLYFHAVPLYSELSSLNPDIAVQGFGGRFPTIRPDWVQNLYNFTNLMRQLGLGLRYTYPWWTPMGMPVGQVPNQYPSQGNGTPIAAMYGFAGTGPQTYTFQMNVPTVPFLGKFRVILRQFKNLRVLNKRHPAFGWINPSNGFYYVNVRMNAPNYLPWDGLGYLTPEIFSSFQPSPCPPLTSDQLPGVSSVLLTDKKLGRPFGLQRGRALATVR